PARLTASKPALSDPGAILGHYHCPAITPACHVHRLNVPNLPCLTTALALWFGLTLSVVGNNPHVRNTTMSSAISNISCTHFQFDGVRVTGPSDFFELGPGNHVLDNILSGQCPTYNSLDLAEDQEEAAVLIVLELAYQAWLAG